jgi:hypothetical protein
LVNYKEANVVQFFLGNGNRIFLTNNIKKSQFSDGTSAAVAVTQMKETINQNDKFNYH